MRAILYILIDTFEIHCWANMSVIQSSLTKIYIWFKSMLNEDNTCLTGCMIFCSVIIKYLSYRLLSIPTIFYNYYHLVAYKSYNWGKKRKTRKTGGLTSCHPVIAPETTQHGDTVFSTPSTSKYSISFFKYILHNLSRVIRICNDLVPLNNLVTESLLPHIKIKNLKTSYLCEMFFKIPYSGLGLAIKF